MAKIIVFGFPHCGTSIIKSIIGHIDEVDEICDEMCKPNRTTTKKYILCKYPFALDKFFSNEFRDYIKIFIIRNPLWVFSSLNKRFSYTIPDNHGIEQYVDTLKKFIHYKNNCLQNLYTIRYEDMFCGNHKHLRNIFDDIKFRYTNKIFNNTKFKNKTISFVHKIPDIKPQNTNHALYRTYQINQPFVNNNDPQKIDLSEKQKKIIMTNRFINMVYPNIGSFLKCTK